MTAEPVTGGQTVTGPTVTAATACSETAMAPAVTTPSGPAENLTAESLARGEDLPAVGRVLDEADIRLDQAVTAARHAYRDTARLIRLLAVIAAPRAPGELVDDTLTVLSEVFGCDITCLAHGTADRLLVTNSCGLPEGDPAFVDGWPLTDAPAQALRTSRVVVRSIDDTSPDLPESLRGLGIRSAIWVPLSADVDENGLLLLFRSGEPFNQSDLPVLDSVSYRLRLALQERERSVVMERLAQVGHLLARHLDPQPLFDEAAELLRLVSGADAAWVVTLDEDNFDGGKAQLRSRSGGPVPGDWPVLQDQLPGWGELSRGRPFTGPAGGELHGPTQPGPTQPGPTQPGLALPGPLLAVPVLRDGAPVAVLYGARHRPRPFTQDAVEIVNLFGSYLRVAMGNAELYHALGRSEESLRLITDSISDMISVIEPGGTFAYASPSFVRELGHEPGRLIGRQVSEMVHADDRGAFSEALTATLDDRAPASKVEYRLQTGDGCWVWVESALRTAPLAGSTAVLSSRVIDERKRLEVELRQQATQDPLTGLANRMLAGQHLDRMLGVDKLGVDKLVVDRSSLDQGAEEQTEDVGVLFCDLDKFKAINDRLGHEAGDDLLLQVAARLRTCLRPNDLLARFGGDEFVVVLDDVREPGDLAAAGRRVLGALDAPFILADERVRVSASIGGVLGGRGTTTASAMLRDADAAMYAAKDRGGNDVVVFDDAASRRALDRLGVRSDLLLALERGELWVAYQPIHDLPSGEVAGFEALLRWTHPQRGPVPPEVFIPLAEETGAIVPFGSWVLGQACARLAEWQGLVPGRRLQISVNLSALQLRRPAAAETLEVIRSAGVDPSDVWLELTENEHLPNEATSFITTLRDAGVHFALDDFGMSHSNLSYLRRLPVERLKVDRSFVAGMTERDVDRGIVNAVLVIADSLGLDVVAEGIETLQQQQALIELDCRLGQGYLLSTPLPPEEVRQLLARRPALSPTRDDPGTTG